MGDDELQAGSSSSPDIGGDQAGSDSNGAAQQSGSTPEGDPYERSWDESNPESEQALDASQADADSNFPSTPVDDASSPCGTPRNSPSQQKDSSSEKTWIEYVLVDDKGKPVPGLRYRVKAGDGTLFDGNFDRKGKARIGNINPGNCKIWILDVDGQEWKKG